MWRLSIPKIDGAYTGTGDLTAALFLAWLHPKPPNSESDSAVSGGGSGGQLPSLPWAMARVVGTVAAVIQRPRDYAGHDPYGESKQQAAAGGGEGGGGGCAEKKKEARGGELRLIQSKRDIESPDTSAFVPTPIPTETIDAGRVLLLQKKRRKAE